MAIKTALTTVLATSRAAAEDEARDRLADTESLSLNERMVLEELGPREEWPERLLDLGRQALDLAENLAADAWRDSYIVQDAVDPNGPYYAIPRQGLELAIVERFISSFQAQVTRAQDLVWSTFTAELSPRVAAYLSRIGRCYVAGFDEEVVILCRSVLDVALRDALGDDLNSRSSLFARIEDAGKDRRLSDESIRKAHEIRLRGNNAVHEEPAPRHLAESSFKATAKVLTELFEGEG